MATFRQPTLPSPQELRDKTYHRGYAADDGTRVMYQRDWAKQHLLEGDGLLPLFYDHLSKIDRSHEQRLRGVCLPDTVVYEHNFPRAWYGWDRETQEIVKRPGRDLDARTIYAEFCERKDRKCDIIAQYCYVRGAEAAEEEVAGGATRRRGAHFLQTQRQHHDDDDEDENNDADETTNSARGQRANGGLHRRNSQQKKLHEELERERRRREKEMQQIYRPDTCVEFFTSETLYAFLTNPKPKPDGVLQRFVLPKGKSSSRHNFQLQAIWSPVVTLVYKRTNRYLLGDTTIGVAQRAPTFDGPPHLSTESLVAGSTLNRIDIVCRAIADHITFTEKKPIERLIAYFKEDDEDRLWLMWASSLRVGGDQLNPVHIRVPMNLALRVETIRTILPKAEASKANTIENDEDALLSKDVQLFDMTGDRDFARKCGGDLFPVNSSDHHHHSKKQQQSYDDDEGDDQETTSNTTATKSPPHSARASAASGMTSSLQLPAAGGGSSASMTSNNVLLTPHPPKTNNNANNNTDDETSNATNNLNNLQNNHNPMNESVTSGLSNTIGSMGSGATGATNVTTNNNANNTSFSGAVPSSPRNTKNRFNPNNYAKGVLPPSILLEKLEREQQQQMQQQQQGNDYGSNSPDSPTLSNNNNNNNNQRENSTARRRNSPPLSGRSTTNTNRPGTSARSTGASTTNASYYSSSGSKSGNFPHKIFISPRAPFLALSHATHVPTIKEDNHPFHRAVTNSEKEHHRAEREKKLNREVGRSARKPPAAIVLLPGYKEAYAQQNRRRLSFKTASRAIEDAEKLKSELLRFSQDMMYEAHSSSLASAKSIDRDFQVPVPPLLTQCLDENELESLCRVMRVKSAQLVPVVNSDGTSGVRVVVTVPGGVSGRGSRKDRPLVQLNDDVKMFYEFLFEQNGQVLWDRYCGAAM